jgi:hypothetical protein
VQHLLDRGLLVGGVTQLYMYTYSTIIVYIL